MYTSFKGKEVFEVMDQLSLIIVCLFQYWLAWYKFLVKSSEINESLKSENILTEMYLKWIKI
jgi:hypothetical protein